MSREAPPRRPGEATEVSSPAPLPPVRAVAALPPRAVSPGVAVGRQTGRAQVTTLVLSLRRQAEAEAQEQLRRVRVELELARQAEAHAVQLLDEAEYERQRLSRALSTTTSQPAEPNAGSYHLATTPALLLASQSERLLAQRQLVRDRQRQRDAQALQVQTLIHRQGELHAALRMALARREAAELHQAEERREQKRIKAQRQRTLEEDVRDRFLSAQRLAKTPRR